MANNEQALKMLDNLRKEFKVEENDEKTVFEHTHELEEELEKLERKLSNGEVDPAELKTVVSKIVVRIGGLEEQMEQTLEEMDQIRGHAIKMQQYLDQQ